MPGELFIVSNSEKDLDLFGRYIFNLLSIKFDEIRYSDNVSGGSYLTGSGLGLQFKIESADLQEFEEYDFLFSFSPLIRTRSNKRYNFGELADTVAEFLASRGMKIARPLDFAKKGVPPVIYTPT